MYLKKKSTNTPLIYRLLYIKLNFSTDNAFVVNGKTRETNVPDKSLKPLLPVLPGSRLQHDPAPSEKQISRIKREFFEVKETKLTEYFETCLLQYMFQLI